MQTMNYQQLLQVLEYAEYLFRENARILKMLRPADLTGQSEEYLTTWYYAYRHAFDGCIEASGVALMYKLELQRRRSLVGN